MKNIIYALLATLLLCGACARRVEKSSKAEEREQWIASLEDSVATLQKEASESEMRLDEATASVSEMLKDFEYVNNSREVEGYTILKGWSSRYPLASTGLVARITESEGLELVAALSGGSFTRIEVSSGGESVSSATVPHDQALNYRALGLNTVAFFGQQADSVAAFISSHASSKIELIFLENGVSGKITLPEANVSMISRTWELYRDRREVERLEKTLPLIQSKIRAIRHMKDANQANLERKDSV